MVDYLQSLAIGLLGLAIIGLCCVLLALLSMLKPRKTHIVRPGDSLHSVAAQHGVTVAALMTANAAKPPVYFQEGAELRIPKKRLTRQ